MKPLKRGDTFIFPFKAKEGKAITTGSTVKCAVRISDESEPYALYAETTLKEDTDKITFTFKPEETAELKLSESLEEIGLSYILEVEITDSTGFRNTPYQAEIEIVRDYINDR